MKAIYVSALFTFLIQLIFISSLTAVPRLALIQDNTSDRDGVMVAINEVMASNSMTIADENGDYSDWIELYNYGTVIVNLLNFGLSDDSTVPFKWIFPNVNLQPGSYMLVWASDKNRTVPGHPLHTNFKIGAEGEDVLLTDPAGVLVSDIPVIQHYTDVSLGRYPNAGNVWYYFSDPTPSASNDTQAYSEVLDPPVFSQPGGFYNNSFALSITHQDPDVTIVYTLDGSEPSIGNLDGTTYQYKNSYPQTLSDPLGEFLEKSFQSNLYTTPINVYNRSSEPDKLTHISTTWDLNPGYFPTSPVNKSFVVRAKVFKPNAMPSQTVTNTYFVFSSGRSEYTIPVVSLNLTETEFFDYYDGIYVAGVDRDTWIENNTGLLANWRRDGDEWEYPANMEYFENNSDLAQLNQKIDFTIHGMASNSYSPRKSLRIYARSEYGAPTLNHQFFPEMPDDSFKRLILRNSGNDYNCTQFKDAAIQTVSSGLRFDTQAYRPSILFINGEYWGIHNIRERYDKYYLARVYGVDSENLDLLEQETGIMEGDRLNYIAMKNFITSNDMADPGNYAHALTLLDIDNFTDYNIAEVFSRNQDWPQNNIKYWRLRTNSYIPDAPYGHDGRWRWLMYDTDQGFQGATSSQSVTLEWLIQSTYGTAPLFNAFLANSQFRNGFINRFADLLNTTYLPSRTTGIINQMKQVIEPEIPEHIQRWGAPSSVSYWQTLVSYMIDFANQRPAAQRQHIRDHFGITSDINVTLNVDNDQQGYIHINTIDITPQTEGVVNSPYPWTGIYFNNIPIVVEAIAKPGYTFSNWTGSVNSTERVLNITPTQALNLTAHFIETLNPEAVLIHYWHFNNISGTVTSVPSDFSLVGTPTITYPGTGAGYMDGRTHRAEDPVSNLNLQMGDQPNQGAVLRVRNPANTRALVIDAPTTGYQDIVVTFATTRSSTGATEQEFYYSSDGGQTWNILGSSYAVLELLAWGLVSYDLSEVSAADDNPNLKFRILFLGANASLTSGNDRFDNLSVHGIPLPVPNLAPIVTLQPGLQEVIEAGSHNYIDLAQIFTDPESDPLTFSVVSSRPEFVQVILSGNSLELIPLRRGDALITIGASDGINPETVTVFRVLVYPEAHVLSQGPYTFGYWSADEPELVYPENMIFLQSDVSDPGINYPLLYPYYIPHDQYHADDQATIGFPYKNTGRTRINGLGGNGISFINTGRGIDLGGALLALDTRGISGANLSWLAGTLLRNTRIYALRIQYRTDIEAEFTDLLYNGEPLEYYRATDGDVVQFSPIPLPQELLGQDYLQILCRYYFVSGTSGSRAMLRFDDLNITAEQQQMPVELVAQVVEGGLSLSWDACPGATGYKIYASEDPLTSNWVYIDLCTENQITIPLGAERAKFYRVTALSGETPPESGSLYSR